MIIELAVLGGLIAAGATTAPIAKAKLWNSVQRSNQIANLRHRAIAAELVAAAEIAEAKATVIVDKVRLAASDGDAQTILALPSATASVKELYNSDGSRR